MPPASSVSTRIVYIARNLHRILFRRPFYSYSSKLPTTHQRSRPLIKSFRAVLIILPVFILIFSLLSPFLRKKLQALPSNPLSTHHPLPRSYEPPSSIRSSHTSTLQIVLVVPPFTNSPRFSNFQQDTSQTDDFNSTQVSNSSSIYDPASFQTLLSSITTAYYDGDSVQLQIVLAPHANSESFDKTYTQCTKVKWQHGQLSIQNASTGGLFDLGVSVWSPPPADHSHALIIDASRIETISPNYYRYLKSVRRRYAGIADVAGFTLEPVLIRRQSGLLGQLSQRFSSENVAGFDPRVSTAGNNSSSVFFYQTLPIVGAFSPVNAQVWRSFQRWFAAHRSEWFLWPTVVAPKDKKDPTWNKYRGTLRAHWTLWFSRFCAEYNLYSVYPLQRKPEPVPSLNRASAVPSPLRFDFRGQNVVVKSKISPENLDRIVELGRKTGGAVSLTIVNEAFLETACSWICNVDIAGIRPPGVIWITTDDKSYETLRQVPDSYAIKMQEFKGAQASTGTSYATPGYWLLMLERTQLIQEILQQGVGVFLFETDQIWLRDPVPFVQRLIHSGDEVDIVGTLDTRHEIGGNFLFLNPTLATRRLWSEVCRRFEKAYRDNRIAQRSSLRRKYIENDQSTLTKLVFFNEAFKAKNPVVFRTLDTERFVDGRWYKGREKSTKTPFYFSKTSQSPIVINNNFVKGIDNKKQRAIKHDHWFLTEGKCNVERVKKAVRENEEREAANSATNLSDESQDSNDENDVTTHGSTGIRGSHDGHSNSTAEGASRMEGEDEEAGIDAAIVAMQREWGQ